MGWAVGSPELKLPFPDFSCPLAIGGCIFPKYTAVFMLIFNFVAATVLPPLFYGFPSVMALAMMPPQQITRVRARGGKLLLRVVLERSN
jgi:hypothetical protein